jgi:3-methylcrotonyl-CoA carboxylase alpha subunit
VLAQTQIKGIETNSSFLQAVLESSAFLRAEVDTGFLHNHQELLQLKLSLNTLEKQLHDPAVSAEQKSWGAFSAWRNFGQNQFSREFHVHRLPAPGHDADASAGGSGSAQLALKAPLPGKLIALHVKVGDKVTRGQPLLVMEAMKMEHTVKASADCVIAAIHCTVNDFLQPDQLMVEFTDPVSVAVEA